MRRALSRREADAFSRLTPAQYQGLFTIDVFARPYGFRRHLGVRPRNCEIDHQLDSRVGEQLQYVQRAWDALLFGQRSGTGNVDIRAGNKFDALEPPSGRSVNLAYVTAANDSNRDPGVSFLVLHSREIFLNIAPFEGPGFFLQDLQRY